MRFNLYSHGRKMLIPETLLHRGNDLSTYFLPHAYWLKRFILQNHQIPLWSPIQFTGIPYLADPQNYLFYFPNYLFLLFTVETAFIVLLTAHLIWAGLGTYILAKYHFKLTRSAAVFAALVFILTPKIFSHLEAGHYSMLIAFSWLPWFFHIAFKFIHKPSLKHICLLSLAAWALYINYITIAYYAFIFLGFYVLYSRKLRLTRYLLFAFLFFLLISPGLIAQLKFASLSTRSLITYKDVAQPIWSFSLFAQNLFFPFLLNNQQLSTERVLFPGIIIWILAIIGWFKFKSKYKYFYLGWLIFSLLFALGDRIPFFIFFYKYFPLVKRLRVTTRPWIITNLFLGLFAGLGLPKKFPALILLSFIDIVFVNWLIFQKPAAVDPTPISFYQIIQDARPPSRVYCTTGCFSLFKLGQLGIWSLSGNNPIQSLTFVNDLQQAAGYSYSKYTPVLPPYEVFDSKPQPNSDLMAKLQLKYIASPYVLTDPGFALIREDQGFFLYTLK